MLTKEGHSQGELQAWRKCTDCQLEQEDEFKYRGLDCGQGGKAVSQNKKC